MKFSNIKLNLFIFTFCIILSGCVNYKIDDTAISSSITSEIIKMRKNDQRVQKEFNESLALYGVENIPADIKDNFDKVQAHNASRVKEIINEYGWLTEEQIGKEGVEAMFFLVHHSSDSDFQKSLLPSLEKANSAGEIGNQEYALFTDRVLVGSNLPQRYGTQVRIVNRETVLYPVENMSNLDKRREEIGLPPIKVYLDLVQEMLGVSLSAENLSELSIE
ncbi:DUF6624 domain-containing protein [Vibrio caribbeanicus]|jgi:hypothetical protein|uniref:Lipoprotein n=1 Tax=Vibrio caribbeanicus ATCC BAA-2122 TaxID=796620 RepID=E3BGK8_9VIBR|nr:DUF6624 domain-containing protein [Vibrio caribbeanicus]EFP97816.1 hypothetical protein VIBC2010_00934 [Vibrio caribbeanicus ATCC BAA-2122]